MGRIAVSLVMAALGLAPLTSAAPASAADYPTKPIRLVVGFTPGGPTDIPARFIADKLSDRLGQRVVVENKPVAAGMVATRDVLSQPRDGYTLLLCTHFEPINIASYKNPGFRLDDIAPISLISEYYYALALSLRTGTRDFRSFVQYARAHPDDVSYATIGAGSAQEILARQLGKLADISMIRIPYRGGPQVIQEMLAGRVDLFVSPTLAVLPPYQAKQMAILAITAPERLKSVPEIPTLKEAGIDYVRFGWLGICAGAGTPQPIVERLNREIGAIVATPEYRTLIETAGSIPISSTPAELGRVIKQTLDDVAATIQEYGLQQEQ
jgi:tripartite-type tricarboxylate transporter receptor subunit TctC